MVKKHYLTRKAIHAQLGSLPLAKLIAALIFALTSALIAPTACWAHGFAGQRFFPATLTIDDPFVADEGDILFGHSVTPNDSGGNVTTNSTSLEFAKRITSNFGLSLATEYDNLQFSNGDPSQRGFNNLIIGAKYLSLVDAPHEALMAVGLNATLGSTGNSAISDSVSTISPAVFFGKGLGDLPSSLEYLQPSLPTSRRSIQCQTLSTGVLPSGIPCVFLAFHETPLSEIVCPL
jgi:hypothetical protein